MRQFLRNNGLTVAMFGLFLATLVGLVFTGWDNQNQELMDHGQSSLDLLAYLASGGFIEAVFENWESEFLQMGSYVLLTVYLYQRGSSESKDPDKEEEVVDRDPRDSRDDPDVPWPVRRGGLILRLYEHSLTLAFVALFLISFALHAVGGADEYTKEQAQHGGEAVDALSYLTTSRFWFESFQNWQSEYLSVGVLIVLTVYLRERGSPESKPVDAPHLSTGT